MIKTKYRLKKEEYKNVSTEKGKKGERQIILILKKKKGKKKVKRNNFLEK